MKAKCNYCKAKSRIKVMYRGQMMCQDCRCEYAAMIDGWVSNARKKKAAYVEKINAEMGNNPLWDAFRRGWEFEEKEKNLPHMEIPEETREYYKILWMTAQKTGPHDRALKQHGLTEFDRGREKVASWSTREYVEKMRYLNQMARERIEKEERAELRKEIESCEEFRQERQRRIQERSNGIPQDS